MSPAKRIDHEWQYFEQDGRTYRIRPADWVLPPVDVAKLEKSKAEAERFKALVDARIGISIAVSGNR